MAIANIKVTLLCPIEKVGDKVTGLHHFDWRSNLKNIKVIDDEHFIEITKDGTETYFKVTECVKYQCWSFEVENENIKGNWTGRFYSNGNHTTLDFTEDVIAKKIIFKPFIASYLRKQQKIYFQDLKRELRCGEASYVPKL